MKHFILSLTILLSSVALFAQPGGQKIKFTAKKNPSQNNQFQIFAKNVTASVVSGNLGASLLTISIGVPITIPAASLTATATSPIAGQTFGPVLMSDSGTTRIYTWNGTGSTAVVDFQPNVEVQVATVSFDGVLEVRPVKLMMVKESGPSFFDVCYIAPGAIDQTDYSNPFYSNIVGDVNLRNCGGTNDATPSCTSSFTVGDVALPTKFISFFANKKDDNADLIWTVANEENNAYFDVQRSLDGRVFTDAIRVNALRNGRTSNTYTIPDVNISRLGSKVLYYRIKQVEAGGEIVYSEVRQLNLTTKNFAIGLYPNPVVSATKLVVDAPEAGKAFIIIRDAAGKTVQQINMEFVKGVNQKELNASMLPAGDYNVTVMGEKFNQTIKMTKAN